MTDLKQGETTKHAEENDGKYRELFREFADNSSAGGINKVFSPAKPLLIRTIWMMLCVTCYGVMAYLSLMLIEEYLGKPTKTFVDVSFQRDMSFPSVTVCNLNKFRQSALKRNLPKVYKVLSNHRRKAKILNSMKEEGWKNEEDKRLFYLRNIYAQSGVKYDEIDADSVSSEEILNQLILQASTHYSDEELSASGYTFDNLIIDCRWMGVKCHGGYFRKYWTHLWNWKYGNCYVFNFGLDSNGTKVAPLITNKAGPSNGLQIDVFLAQREYIGELSEEAGVKVVIVDQMQQPFPFHEGVAVDAGKSTSIALRKELIERVDAFKNDSCVGDSVQKENIYSVNGSLIYTVQSCLDTCLVGYQQRKCNCTDVRYPVKKVLCSTTKQYQCIADVDYNYKGDEYGCMRSCPQRCKSVSYRTTLSNAGFSTQSQDGMRKTLNRSDKFRNSVKTKDDFQRDFLRVKIYFEELNLVRIRQQSTYSISNLLADIGGQLGLWVGLSVITVAELGDLLLSLLILMFSKTDDK